MRWSFLWAPCSFRGREDADAPPHKVNRLLYLLLHEDTTLLRLFFGIASLIMGAFIGFDDDFKYFHETALKVAPQWVMALMFSRTAWR
jgi:hypothetical protein